MSGQTPWMKADLLSGRSLAASFITASLSVVFLEYWCVWNSIKALLVMVWSCEGSLG